MKRRDLLKLGAAAGAGTAMTGGCALPHHLEVASERGSAEAFLATLDRQLPVIDRARFVDRFVKTSSDHPRSSSTQAEIDRSDAVFRRMLRALLISQSFRDLPQSARLHPDVQQRMSGHIDEIGASVFEVSDMLAALDVDQRDRVQSTLRARPDLPMALAESLGEHAALAGISHARRLQIRSMMAHTSFRMKHGDPGVVIDEYVAKVERVRAQGATDATALALAQRMGERAFWASQAQDAVGGPPGTMAPMPQPAPGMPAPTGPHPGSRGLRTGAYMMGIGVVVFGASAALLDATEAGGWVVGLTVGAVLFAIGIIVLLISAIVYASND